MPPATLTQSLIEDERAFEQLFQVRCYEVGVDKAITVYNIANLLQECAASHACCLWGEQQWAPKEMLDANLALVMTKLAISVDTFPRWNQVIRIETFFFPSGRMAARRDWVVSDATTGEQLARASSKWVAFDIVNRKLGRFPEPLREEFTVHSPAEERFALPDSELLARLPEIPAHSDESVSACAVNTTMHVREYDVDMNAHTNNSVYIRMIMEELPEECKARSLKQLELEFKNEALVGDVLEAVACTSEALEGIEAGADAAVAVFHGLRKSSDESEVIRARSLWV